jgi:anti-sigma regulatory factor (Ser/Thr protein kinase)
MAAHDTHLTNGNRLDPAGTPFPRYERSRAAGWQAAAPPAISRLQLRMRPGPEAATEGRHALDRLDGALDAVQLETLRLLVTELITNAVRHARCREWIDLHIDLYPDSVHAQVVDSGVGFQPPEQPTPHGDRPGGWGLCLVDRLADRWGVTPDNVTRVWFELERDGGRAAAA